MDDSVGSGLVAALCVISALAGGMVTYGVTANDSGRACQKVGGTYISGKGCFSELDNGQLAPIKVCGGKE